MLPRDLGGTDGDHLDNKAAVDAAKKLDQYFQNHVENILTKLNDNKNQN